MVKTIQISANAYFILSGLQNDEGVVVARTYKDVFDMSSLSDKRWYVIQTNYDRTNLEPINDVRKTFGILRMELIG